MKPKTNELSNYFIRGAVATALLSALSQTKNAPNKTSGKQVLKHALQGGFAAAAGMGVANAIESKEYQQALLLVLGGSVGIAGAELLIKDSEEANE